MYKIILSLFSLCLILTSGCTKKEIQPSMVARVSFDVNGEHVEEVQYTPDDLDPIWNSSFPVGIGTGFQFDGVHYNNGHPDSIDYQELEFFYEALGLHFRIKGKKDGPFIEGHKYGPGDLEVWYVPDTISHWLHMESQLLSAILSFDYTKENKSSKMGILNLLFDFTEVITARVVDGVLMPANDTVVIANGICSEEFEDAFVNLILKY